MCMAEFFSLIVVQYAGEIKSGLDEELVLTREDVYKVHMETINPDVPPMDDFPPLILFLNH